MLDRAPKVGERGWWADEDSQLEDVLFDVMAEIETDREGNALPGWVALRDYEDADEDGDGMRPFTIVIEIPRMPRPGAA